MQKSKGDSLNTPEEAYLPDSRALATGISDISIQYSNIEPYQLEAYVPESIVNQYEVARNLYLYAFHVYKK